MSPTQRAFAFYRIAQVLLGLHCKPLRCVCVKIYAVSLQIACFSWDQSKIPWDPLEGGKGQNCVTEATLACRRMFTHLACPRMGGLDS